jgi:signal transduction histidine kinase
MNESKIPKPKCLIVDDLKENIIALESLLRDEYVECIHAQSGVEALSLLLEHDFALALVDVQMPGMDGFELAEIMRSTEKTRGIPLIFVTAATTDAHRVFQGYERGAVDFLQKPLAPQIVLSKVRIFIELFNQKVLLQQKLRKIEETEAGLQKALKARDDFFSICSHELKTPLTTLKMQIQLVNHLRERKGDEVAFGTANMEKFLSHADRSVERIIHLVNDMLDISRMQTGRLTLNVERVELDRTIHDVVDRLKPFCELAGCEVRSEIHSNVTGLWDRFRIEQVIINLITNAAKYAPDAPIEVHAGKQDGMAVIKVKDYGPGISVEDQKRIFERFERATGTDAVSGLGLGLFISKEIIDLHHGKISVESELGKGSTFKVVLPLL